MWIHFSCGSDIRGERQLGFGGSFLMGPDDLADSAAHHPGDRNVFLPGDLGQNGVITRIQADGEPCSFAVSTRSGHALMLLAPLYTTQADSCARPRKFDAKDPRMLSNHPGLPDMPGNIQIGLMIRR